MTPLSITHEQQVIALLKEIRDLLKEIARTVPDR